MEELKIRGKRKRRQPQVSGVPRSRGRPMKPASEILANKKAKLSRRLNTVETSLLIGSADHSHQNDSISYLEKLPIELVQQIFFHCLEVNMIKASAIIRKMLSTESTYKLLILFAFFDDDGRHPVETGNFKPVGYRDLPIQERIRLQESILSCRWCSLRRIENCMPTLTRLKMVQEWHKENNISKKWPANLSTPSIEGRSPALPPLDDTTALEVYFHVHKRCADAERATEAEQLTYFPRLRPYEFQQDRTGHLIKRVRIICPGHRPVFPSTLAARHIPENLLTGQPWSEKNLRFLALLRQGFRHITRDFILHILPTALFGGMTSAIKEHNPTALLTLLELHDTAFHIKKTSLAGHKVQNHNPHNQRYTTPHAHPLPLSLFHLTTKQPYPIAQPLLSLLIRGGLDSIPQDDAILTKWALTASASDTALDSVGAFILNYMEGTWSAFEREGLFQHGKLHAGLEQRFKWCKPASFAEEIGYEAPSRDWQFSVMVESGEYV